MNVESNWYAHVDDEGRLNGIMPAYFEQESTDEDGNIIIEQVQNVNEGDLEEGWFPWFLDNEPPEDFTDYLFINGELRYSKHEPTDEEMRYVEINEAHSELPEIRDGLMEVAEMSANNEATLDDIVTALIELADIVGSE